MKKLSANEDGWYCGWWNDSPLQINYAQRKELYKNECEHYHEDFFEYYLVVSGHIILKIDGQSHRINENELCIVEPKERHEVIEVSGNCKYLTIKSKSYKGNKVMTADSH